MADQEFQKTANVEQVLPTVVVDRTDVPEADDHKPAEKEKTPPPAPETDEPVKPSGNGDDEKKKIPQSVSFKEETTKVSELPDYEKKALEELKQLVQLALENHEFTTLPPPVNEEQKPVAAAAATEEETKRPIDDEKEGEPPVAEVLPPELDGSAKPETEDEADKTLAPATPPPEPTAAVGTETVAEPEQEKATAAVDDDGAKTVEAIEETIVAVSTPAATEPAVAEAPESEPKPAESEKTAAPPSPPAPEEVFIWGIKLLEDDRSDVILLKFLRARDFRVKDAFGMLKNTIRWRKQFRIDELLEEEIDLDEDLQKAVFMNGYSKEGHPVCYNVYGQFQNKELYQKTFSDEERRLKFLRWRIQFLEKSIRKLDLSPGGISTIVQVNDLKNSPGPGKWELRQATKQALQLLQDNYPEFVAKQVFINVPWWYLAVNRMISPFLTQRTRSKFVFAGPSKSAETLFKYIAAEQVPVKYGGLSKDGDFVTTDAVTEITVRASAKHTVEFPVTEKCLLSWEIRVVGWEVSYGAEFVPSAEGGYTVIIQKARKVGSTEEAVIRNSFKIDEPGKVVLTIDNPTSKKKKLLYRLKTKSSLD